MGLEEKVYITAQGTQSSAFFSYLGNTQITIRILSPNNACTLDGAKWRMIVWTILNVNNLQYD